MHYSVFNAFISKYKSINYSVYSMNYNYTSILKLKYDCSYFPYVYFPVIMYVHKFRKEVSDMVKQ